VLLDLKGMIGPEKGVEFPRTDGVWKYK